MTLTADGRLLLFGGMSFAESGMPKYNEDVRQLDTDNMVAPFLFTANEVINSLSSIMFSIITQIWTRPRISGHVPTGRYGHTSTLLSDGKIVVFGGWGKSGCQSRDLINDSRAYSLQILDTKTMVWYVPRKLGHKDLKHLYNHSACKASGSTVFFFGGFDGRQALCDFYTLNIE